MSEHLVCPECEQEHAMACCGCGSVLESNLVTEGLVTELRETVFNLHHELDAKLRTIKRLKKENDQRLENHPRYDDAMIVLEYWRDVCHPGAKELRGERLRNVIARLTGTPRPYTVEDLKRCVDGYAAFPYVVNGRRRVAGSPKQRFADAELIFRAPKQVDTGIALSQEGDYLNGLVHESPPPQPPENVIPINGRNPTFGEKVLSLFDVG